MRLPSGENTMNETHLVRPWNSVEIVIYVDFSVV